MGMVSPACGGGPNVYAVIFRHWTGEGWPRWLGWIGRWLAPGYGHVSVLWWDRNGRAWCYVDPCAWGLVVQAADGALTWAEMLDVVAAGATRVVTVELPAPARAFKARGLYTCVMVVKAVLGLGDWRVVTPHGLYRRLSHGSL